MKTIARKQTVEIESENEVKSFGMVVDAKSFGVIVDGIYSNTINAIIREYCCNAIDSHKQAGHMRPFDVHLPELNNTNFTIRDYGVGLDEEDIVNVFTVAFKSTKENTNLVTGQLGIGAMCAFAYNTKSFTVTSWKNGTKYIYSCFINEDGCPAYLKISEEKSDEHNGVQIDIPCSKNDIYSFGNAAQEIVSKFDIRPNINVDISYLDEIKPLLDGDGWAIYDKYTVNFQCSVLMGNVLYTIPQDNRLSQYKDILETNTIIRAEIGDVDFSTSREYIKLTARTLKYLEKTFANIKDSITNYIEGHLKSSLSIFDAINNVLDIKSKISKMGLFTLFRKSLQSAIFNNVNLNAAATEITKNISRSGIKYYVPKNTLKGYKIDKHITISIMYSKYKIYHTDKLGYSEAIGRSVKNDRHIAIIFPSTFTTNQICDACKCSPSEIILASSLPKLTGSRYNSKRGSLGIISKWQLSSFATRAWKTCEEPKDTKSTIYYVPRSGYNIITLDGSSRNPSWFHNYNEVLSAYGISDVYAVQEKYIKNLPSNWVNAISYCKKLIKEKHLEDIKAFAIKYKVYAKVSSHLKSYDSTYNFIDRNTKLLKDNPLYKWFDFVKSNMVLKDKKPPQYDCIIKILNDEISEEISAEADKIIGNNLSIVNDYEIIEIALDYGNRVPKEQILKFIGA